jgi:hypothetical protein
MMALIDNDSFDLIFDITIKGTFSLIGQALIQ